MTDPLGVKEGVIESKLVDEFEERETVGARGLGTGKGSRMRLLVVELDSVLWRGIGGW